MGCNGYARSLTLNDKVIIGIHGLSNKADAETLRAWWKAAMSEGLLRNCGVKSLDVDVELAYWADLMYPAPAVVSEMQEPYLPAEGEGPLPRARLSVGKLAAIRVQEGVGKVLEKLFGVPLAEEFISDALEARMPDLHRYKHDWRALNAVRARLIELLEVAQARGQQIMLMAHSMGSIVAYETLREAWSTVPELEVAQFVTMGSPLGLAEVKEVVVGPLRVPECVARWSNFADPRDRVCRWDTFLNDEYAANSRGVTVSDHLIINGYVSPAGEPNPHKIYGYLRAPEMSDLLSGFVG